MKFLKNFLLNLGFLFVFGVVIFLLYPDMMRQIFQLYSGLFGPGMIFLLLAVAALPRKRRR